MNHTIQRLAGSIRAYKKDSLLTPAFVALEVIMEVIIPLILASLIDDGITGGNMGIILQLGLALFIAAILSLIFGVLAGKFAASASAGFACNLRHDIFYNVQNFSFANIDKFSTSSIVTRLTTDVTNVQNAYQMIIRIAVRCPLMLILSYIMVIGINPQLSLIFLLLIPILAISMYLIILKVQPLFEKVFKTFDRLNKVVQEDLRGIRVVKSYVREEYEDNKFKNVSKDIAKYFTGAEKLLAFVSPMMQFVVYLAILLVSWFGAQFIVAGSLTTGQLVSLFAYTIQILMSLMMLAMVFVMITMSRASAKRIVEILDEKSNLTNPPNPIFTVKNGDITFRGVDFKYSADAEKNCLQKINLEIKSGETIGILGGTGSSKTTFVQLIPRLYDVTEGSVLVGGVDVRDYDLTTLRNQVAVVLQKNILFTGTIKENLRWGDPNASDEELVRVCKLACADEFIQNFPDKYDTMIEQGGSNVSGGQKQRLCIARALLKKPKILILDDSTSAVDTKNDAQIRKAFREEIPNTTKLIIAQRFSSVEDADKIIIIDKGHINAVGTHVELLQTNPIYREVYSSQNKGVDE
jgi:ATP-binding cassette subfamily B protein